MIPIDVHVITEISHPALFDAFETISHDKGTQAGHKNYAIPMDEFRFSELTACEIDLGMFRVERPKLFDVLLTGEETKVQQIVREFKLEKVDKLLQRFFEDFS